MALFLALIAFCSMIWLDLNIANEARKTVVTLLGSALVGFLIFVWDWNRKFRR